MKGRDNLQVSLPSLEQPCSCIPTTVDYVDDAYVRKWAENEFLLDTSVADMAGRTQKAWAPRSEPENWESELQDPAGGPLSQRKESEIGNYPSQNPLPLTQPESPMPEVEPRGPGTLPSALEKRAKGDWRLWMRNFSLKDWTSMLLSHSHHNHLML